MIIILQKYIFKELLRAFVMTAIALTCMLGFGGGLMDMLRTSGITAGEMVKLLIYLMPVVLAYSLPVSALFSTTITYGRLAADNEINACRAGGINIYKLLLPAAFLSIIVFLSTFILENYSIPKLAQQIERLVSRDLQTVIYTKLKSRGYVAYMNYALHCGRVDAIEQPKILPDGTVTQGQIQLSEVAFLRHEGGMPIFYGTARTALILFKTINRIRVVDISLNQVRAFDERKGQMIQAEYYPIGPFKMMGKLLRKRLKFLSLPEILEISDNPMKYPELASNVNSLKELLKVSLVYQYLAKQLDTKQEISLRDKNGTYTITASSYRQNPNDGRIILEGDVVLVNKLNSGGYRKFLARDAVIRAESYNPSMPLTLNIFLKDVKVSDSRDVDPDRFVHHDSFTFDYIPAPEEPIEQAGKITLDELLDLNNDYNYNRRLAGRRITVAEFRTKVVNRAISEIHSRIAYSSSVIVLMLLGAGLGIIFKGGHFVSAFGLSFIPMLIVIVMIMTGKQLCNAGFSGAGVFSIWLGIAIVALSSIIVLGKFLRR